MQFQTDQSFAAKVADFIEQVDYRIAVTDEDRDVIYRLRYDAYLREGAIAPNRQKRFRDKFDDLANVWIFGLYLNNRLASSLSIHIASNLHRQSPAMDIFPDVLTPHINAGSTVSDPTRFVADPDMARENPYLPY
ncbi:MAG: N-acyl amino acid synthase FeeM domain-containing protein, partial [Beijerinckiaceae bacterium]